MKTTTSRSEDDREDQYFRGGIRQYRLDLVVDFLPFEHRASLRIVENIKSKSTDASLVPDPGAEDFIYFDEKQNIPEGKTMHPDSSRAAACLKRLFCPVILSGTKRRKGRNLSRMSYIYHRTTQDGHSRRDIQTDKEIDQAVVDYQLKLYERLLKTLPMTAIEEASESAVIAAVGCSASMSDGLSPSEVFLAVSATLKWLHEVAPAKGDDTDWALVLLAHVASHYGSSSNIKNEVALATHRSCSEQLIGQLCNAVDHHQLDITCRLLAEVMRRMSEYENA